MSRPARRQPRERCLQLAGRGHHGDGPRRVSVRAQIKIRLTELRPPHEVETEMFGENGWRPGNARGSARPRWAGCDLHELSAAGYPFVNEQMHKKEQAKIINDLAERYPMIVVAQTVDKVGMPVLLGPPPFRV